MMVVLVAIVLVPDDVADAAIMLVDCPRPREGVVDDRDLVVHDFRVGFVEIDPLFHDCLIVVVERDSGKFHGAGPLKLRVSTSRVSKRPSPSVSSHSPTE